MNKRRLALFRVPCLLLAIGLVTAPAAADPPRLTLHQVLQMVMDNYSALDVADLELKRARYEVDIVQRRLAWRLNGRAGVSRDVSMFSIRSDMISGGFGAGRQFERGGRFDIEGLLDYSDAGATFAPTIPDPTTVTRLNVRYREPLWRGRGNPAYAEAFKRAETAGLVADVDRDALRDQIAAQTIELFHAAARTYANLENAKRSIDRAKRLKSYIGYNADLGIAEEKDTLQADAQFKGRSADEKALRVAWQQQIGTLNRLMKRPAGADLLPVLQTNTGEKAADLATMTREAQNYNPALRSLMLNLDALDATVEAIRDRNRDLLDVIATVGPRHQTGDLAVGSFSDTELVGLLGIEYQRSLDDRAKQSELAQALTDQDILRQQARVINEDLEYDIRRLNNEIRAGAAALAAYRSSVASEQRKLEEASKRYREGRADTDELIRFEGDLFAAELLAERQAADLSRNLYNLSLLRGRIWDPIRFAPRTGSR